MGALVWRSLLGMGLFLILAMLIGWLTELALRDSQVTIAPNKTIMHTSKVRTEEARALGRELATGLAPSAPAESGQ